jgi:hypothetical protein
VARGDEAGGVPWYAPWRAVDVRTVEDARRAWEMVRELFGNLRMGHPHEVWITDPAAAPPARPMEDCRAALEASGLAFEPESGRYHVSLQVRTAGEFGGLVVSERGSADGDGIAMGCELALRLPSVGPIFRRRGIVRIVVGPPVRFTLRSYHRFGLALDVFQLELDDGRTLVVKDAWEVRAGAGTCEGDPPEDADAALLRALACDLFDARVLSTVITPDYNEGHRDHFHLDVRPGDDRFYLR